MSEPTSAHKPRGQGEAIDAPLTREEAERATAWRDRYGTLMLTREEAGRALLLRQPAVVPLAELFDRPQVSRLRFARRLREAGWES